MADAAYRLADGDSSQRELERLEGELDAAMVFAAGCSYHQQNGDPELAATCLSDATKAYAKVLGAFYAEDFTGAQMHELRAKLIRLQDLLKSLSTSTQSEGA